MIGPSDNLINWTKLQFIAYNLTEKEELTRREAEWFKKRFISESKLNKVNDYNVL